MNSPARILTRSLAILSFAALVGGGCDDGGGGNTDGDSTSTSGDVTSGDVPTDGDVDPSGNQAPELDKIGNRRAPIGKQLSIEVEATDPDGDSLSYSVFGALPDGSKFSKDTHTFEWTPTAADDGALVILTFAVSDGEDEDRETIQITVTASDESTRPELAPIGDQFVEVGVPYELRLQATDEDGDSLVYTSNNPLPNGAELDSKTGLMTWTPSAEQQGSSFRVSFVVSDGEFTDEEDARFLVQTAELSLKKLAPREVAIGETLEVAPPDPEPPRLQVRLRTRRRASGRRILRHDQLHAHVHADGSRAGRHEPRVRLPSHG